MAIEEFICVYDIKSSGGRPIQRTWNGAAAGAQVSDSNLRTARYAIVEAESAAEAVRGINQLYGGHVSGKITVVKKSAVEEV